MSTAAVDNLLAAARRRANHPRRLPEATYRLQFHGGFTFRDAARIADYLHDLGITHCYASPYLRARSGSTHGYDIVDHGMLNPEIGSQDDFNAFVSALHKAGLGQILDTVPNHMGVGTNENAWWNDVLENGPASRFGSYFDIAWQASPRADLQDRVLLPVLGELYGDVLEKGQLRLAFEDGAFAVYYFDRRFPISPRSYWRILGLPLEELETDLEPEDPALLEYQSILIASRNLPGHTETDLAKVNERWREKKVIKRRLGTLAAESRLVREFIETSVGLFNRSEDDPKTLELLDDLLERQCYRLAFWRVAPDEINYRRFFDINDLAALSMEREEVFNAAHTLILRMLAEGKIDGLRIDHPDGLYDPGQYFQHLQERFLLALARQAFESQPNADEAEWEAVEETLRERIAESLAGARLSQWPLYVVAEKILGAEEALVDSWAIDGTSGYDFVNIANGLFVDSNNAAAFTGLYRELIEDYLSFSEVVYRKKLLILQASLASELHMLTHQLDRLAQKSRKWRDFTFSTLRQALREVIACFPVYRSYITDEKILEADRRYVEFATRRAAARNPLISRRVFTFVRRMLLLEYPESSAETDREEQRRFVGKFQQVTAPVTAKGVEDTAFYVYHRLTSLNEVGGEPGRFGISPEVFHRYNGERQAKWPYALSPLSTHDTKRSEDVRSRINALSELPDEWRDCIYRWRQMNEPYRGHVEDQAVPDANEEFLLYQTLVGAWPLERQNAEEHHGFVERIQAYMEKALHEAKVHTSWINPNEEYDAAIREFVARVLDEKVNGSFFADFRAFQQKISHWGLFNSLSQTLLKITCPGAPDTYQGTELWDFSLVDPDNRRPVDYEHRRKMLADLRQCANAAQQDLPSLTRNLLETKEDGRIKLYVTYRALHCRRSSPGLLSRGDYVPLTAHGTAENHVFAFARRAGGQWAVVVVPRLIVGLISETNQAPIGPEIWGDTRLDLRDVQPGLTWSNIFTNQKLTAIERHAALSVPMADVLKDFPVALLTAHS